MANADKIIALPDDELAVILRRCCIGCTMCVACPLQKFCVESDWRERLGQEAEE